LSQIRGMDQSKRHDDALADDNCFYYHSWRNNVVIASSLLT